MTVLSAIRAACSVIGLEIPDVVFASSEREHLELQSLANEMARRIHKEHDWNVLKAIATITGDGTTVSFARPSDYSRMLKEGQLWSNKRKNQPLNHVTDSDIWLSDEVSGSIPENPQWMMMGASLYINPVVLPDETVKYFYIKSLSPFIADTDVFALDERLLTLGIIWQWKANKGQAYGEDMANYGIELESLIKEDRGADILLVGSGRQRESSPYTLPVDYLP